MIQAAASRRVIAGSQVEEVELPSAPATVRSPTSSCGRSGGVSRPIRITRQPQRKRKRKRRSTKRQRGGVKRKSLEVFSTSSEDDRGSDSSFAPDEDDREEDEEMVYVEEDEQEEWKPRRRSRGKPRRHRRIRKDEGDDEDDEKQNQLTSSDDDASVSSSTSKTAVDIQLYCSWCGEDHNIDDFSREQQDNRRDNSRFCLRHHNVGYQRTYDGTSSLKKLEKQFDEIGEKYADVGSDDDEVIEVDDDSSYDVIEVDDDSSDDGGWGGDDKNDDENEASMASPTPKRKCRLSRVAEEEESSDDEDDVDFCAGLSLQTQPHGVLDDDDDDDAVTRNMILWVKKATLVYAAVLQRYELVFT